MKSMLVGVAVLFLAGCGAVSDHPLSDEKDSVVDETLIGTWEYQPVVPLDGAAPRLHIGRAKDDTRTMEAVAIEIKRGHVNVDRFPFFTTKIGARRFVSATYKQGGSDIGAYMIFAYDVSNPDVLIVQGMDEDGVAKEIHAGKIDGNVKPNPSYQSTDPQADVESKYLEVRLTAPPQALRAWIAKAPLSIWRKPEGRFVRVKMAKKK